MLEGRRAGDALDGLAEPAAGERPSTPAPTPVDRRREARRMAWADLLQRVFEVDALCCPDCGARVAPGACRTLAGRRRSRRPVES
jgi:hypothetical protein